MKILDKNLNRRKLFQNVSSMIVAAPLYRMLLDPEALAMGNASKAIFVYIPGGITASQWFPSGTTTNFTLPFISSPLNDLKSDLIMFSSSHLKTPKILNTTLFCQFYTSKNIISILSQMKI